MFCAYHLPLIWALQAQIRLVIEALTGLYNGYVNSFAHRIHLLFKGPWPLNRVSYRGPHGPL